MFLWVSLMFFLSAQTVPKLKHKFWIEDNPSNVLFVNRFVKSYASEGIGIIINIVMVFIFFGERPSLRSTA